MIGYPESILKRYDVSLRNGFLPAECPLEQLPQNYYRPWEEVMKRLPDLIAARTIREAVDALPVLETESLSSESQWRRAYVILSFLSHAYIWGGSQPSERMPPSICRPFLEVADHFDLPRTATYAGLNLWNFAPRQRHTDPTQPENLRSLHTFTGTPDEEWFYLVSNSIEAAGAKVIPIMMECFEAIRFDDYPVATRLLQTLEECIRCLGTILDRMHERCDPDVFYHRIRPFLAGSKGMKQAGLPQGVYYDQGSGVGTWEQYSGGSNAQSTLIQLLDVLLGVEHYATGEAKSDLEISKAKAKQGYLEEMRRYMPQSHRMFLQRIAEVANIREYATMPDANQELQNAYRAAVDSLTDFRNKHIQIIARYIIVPSRKAAAMGSDDSVNIATATSRTKIAATSERAQASGTGGTCLMPFLKQTRDETKRAGVVC